MVNIPNDTNDPPDPIDSRNPHNPISITQYHTVSTTEQTGIVPSVATESDLATLLDDLRSIIQSGQSRAAAAINAEMVQTYWRIGERIVREEQRGAGRADYGTQLLARIGRSLSMEFGRGFAERSLHNMRQFYLTYQIPSTLRTQLTWSEYRVLMRLPDDQRAFYERQCVAGRWSSRELDRQINSMLYERTALSRKPEQPIAAATSEATGRDVDGELETLPVLPGETFKDPYILDFLGLQDTFSERDLEDALIRHIERFLLELGTGFFFGGCVGRKTTRSLSCCWPIQRIVWTSGSRSLSICYWIQRQVSARGWQSYRQLGRRLGNRNITSLGSRITTVLPVW